MTDELATIFPHKDDLLIYGRDIPVPTSFDELKCEYGEKEPTPPLKLEELEGYAVPPDGIIKVSVNGIGFRKGKGGIVYGPGTFRENRHTIDKEFGTPHTEMTLAREQAIQDKVINGLAEMFEEKGIAVIDELDRQDAQVVAAGMRWAFEKIDDADNPKEALNFMKYVWDKLDKKGEVIDSIKDRENFAMRMGFKSLEMVDNAYAALDELIKEKKGEVVEVEAFDVED